MCKCHFVSDWFSNFGRVPESRNLKLCSGSTDEQTFGKISRKSENKYLPVTSNTCIDIISLLTWRCDTAGYCTESFGAVTWRRRGRRPGRRWRMRSSWGGDSWSPGSWTLRSPSVGPGIQRPTHPLRDYTRPASIKFRYYCLLSFRILFIGVGKKWKIVISHYPTLVFNSFEGIIKTEASCPT